MINTQQVRDVAVGIAALGGVYIAYRVLQELTAAYNSVDTAVDSVVDPIASTVFDFVYSGGIEHSDFRLENLWRSDFDANWVMNDERAALMRKIYPSEMSNILTADNQLKPPFREQISYG